MRLVRWGARGAERPGILDREDAIRDLSGVVDDLAGPVLGDLDRLRGLDLETLPRAPEGARVGPCVGRVGKFVCVGLNYADHAAETGAAPPAEPILFFKAANAVAGPGDDLVIPKGSEKTDWEVELGIVVGRRAAHAEEADALSAVAGFCVVNDYSERAWQIERGGQWMKGKSADGFGPIGPWLVTPDDVPDLHALRLWLDVDGVRRQDGSTATMIFKPAFLVSYISRFMTLEPGDVISTGTPPGVGMGQKPPVFLKPGQEVRLGIEGLGEQRQRTVPWSAAG